LICSGLVKGLQKVKVIGKLPHVKTILVSTLIFSLIMFDQILNASLNSWFVFLVGALLGYIDKRRKMKQKNRFNGAII
jgi:UDP-N-acetylmuramyl pentapeptide phosphotransferase/UDP-N-acetylglucosamine-1-phosphate transferase